MKESTLSLFSSLTSSQCESASSSSSPPSSSSLVNESPPPSPWSPSSVKRAKKTPVDMQSPSRNFSISSDDCDSEIISPRLALHSHVSCERGDGSPSSSTSGNDERKEEDRWEQRPPLSSSLELSHLSVVQLEELLLSLRNILGGDKTEKYRYILHSECIDGQTFAQLGHDELEDIGFDSDVKILLQQQMENIFLASSEMSDDDMSVTSRTTLSVDKYSSLFHAPSGVISSLSSPPSSHPPLVYGQFVTLGYHEYRLNYAQAIYPVGRSNEIFPLVRQESPTGMKVKQAHVCLSDESVNNHPYHHHVSHNETTSFSEDAVTTHHMVLDNGHLLQSDGNGVNDCAQPLKVHVEFCMDHQFDMFQIGRYDGLSSSSSSTCEESKDPSRVNDIVLKGLVLKDQPGNVHKKSRASSAAGNRGAISRVACRIMCNRKTGDVFIHAGGFNSSKKLVVGSKSHQWIIPDCSYSSTTPFHDLSCPHRATTRNDFTSSQREDRNWVENYVYDGLTAQGIKVFFPAVHAWREISVMGQVYSVNEDDGKNGFTGGNILTQESNQLYHGCIVDIGGGVCLSFDDTAGKGLSYIPPSSTIKYNDIDSGAHSSSLSSYSAVHNSNGFLARLNKKNPQCPVLMNTLQFPPRLPTQQSTIARMRNLLDAARNHGITSPLSHSGLEESSGIEMDQVPHVFTACGHCFGYDPAFLGKACPLCRHPGPYMPLLFPFAPGICVDMPTHVFHPCGHAASHQTCTHWSQIPMPDTSALHEQLCPQVGGKSPTTGRLSSTASGSSSRHGKRSQQQCMGKIPTVPRSPACPFCSKKLEIAASGSHGFSKLVLQFEDGALSLADI